MDIAAAFASHVTSDAQSFKSRHAAVCAACDTLRSRATVALDEGTESHIARHTKRGQQTARERIALLLDSDSPFLEIGVFAGFGDKTTPKTSICGIGLVAGRLVMILADVPTIRGGAKNAASVSIGERALQTSIENRLPVVSLIQTGGGDLTQQEKVFHRGGDFFRQLAKRSHMKLVNIAVVFGSSTAGGAYHPGMSDYIIMVKGHAKVYLGGPPLVQMATGEKVSHEQLGGATMHATVSGVADYLAADEFEAVRLAREVAATLPAQACLAPERFSHVEEPLYPADELCGILSPSVKDPLDAHEMLARIVDGSRLHLFKPDYGKTLVCGWAKVSGQLVGIIANNGVLFPDSSQKGAQFIQLCNQKDTPIVFFHNITGFMVGRQAERGGIIKYGAQMVSAVSNSEVPHISFIVGASFGAGNYAMCGRAYRPRFLFSFPTAKCSIMGPEQLAGVMDSVANDRSDRALAQARKLEGAGDTVGAALIRETVSEATGKAEAQREKLRAHVEEQMDVYTTSSKMLDDGIIDPRDCRTVLGLCLTVVANAPIEGGAPPGVSRL